VTLLALLAVAVAPARAVAQQGVVAGTVVAEGSQRALPDAQVVVEGTTLGAATDASGRFRITGVTGTGSPAPRCG
jgi:hypothetical protein